jgi:hypothetical protein
VPLGSLDIHDLALGWHPSQTRESPSPLDISLRRSKIMTLGFMDSSRIDQGWKHG